MKRSNLYESAFEGYLQWHRLCYVAVDETRRSFMGDNFVKNLDFIVYGECGSRLLIDVKGRRFPVGSVDKPRRVWECWADQEDVDGLLRWQEKFGADFCGLLVFVYQLPEEEDVSAVAGDRWTWLGKRFLLRAVTVDDYQRHMRVRSPRWQTVCLPGARFRELAQPFHYFTHEFTVAPVDDCPF